MEKNNYRLLNITNSYTDICEINDLDNDQLFDYVNERFKKLRPKKLCGYYRDSSNPLMPNNICIRRETSGEIIVTLNFRIDGAYRYVSINCFSEIFLDGRITICFEIESSCDYLNLHFVFPDKHIQSKIVVKIKKVETSGELCFDDNSIHVGSKSNVKIEFLEVPRVIDCRIELATLSFLSIREFGKLKKISGNRIVLKDFIEKLIDRSPGTLPKSPSDIELGFLRWRLENIEKIRMRQYGGKNWSGSSDSYSLHSLPELISLLS